ncbi:hypothetical protein BaRGS_00029559 [Batillaria attramentaria]|uniref:RING-type E3 ubiquitin transferase n=1 Tax=Batillaria attramentaria TaxID=370345 RepID=A0ABD0JXA4_9CAEN
MDEQALSELLECSVCLERLNHTSKVLPCQHTFCRRCLEEIISTQQELRCPECRTLVTTRVEDLPPNILLVRLLEGLKTQGHVLSSKPASYQRKRDTSSESRQHQTSRAGWDSPQPCARALYSYEASEKDDLTFKKGDMVMLRRQIDDNWYQGELNGQIGVFPASYVQVLVPLPQIPQCRALYDFQLDDENEKDCLTFKKDEVITVIRRVDTNWIEGRKSDKIGILPLAFVELNHAAKTLISSKPPSLSLFHGQSTGSNRTNNATGSRASQQKRHSFTPKSDSPSPPPQAQRHSLELSGSGGGSNSNIPASTASSVANGASAEALPSKGNSGSSTTSGAAGSSGAVSLSGLTTPIYIAMYNYRPQKDDEVELRKGDYYTVTEKCQDGWFKGQCLRTGISGVFPGNYVQLIRTPSAFKPVNPNVLNIRAKHRVDLRQNPPTGVDREVGLQHSMSTSSNITPPNVVMGPAESSSSQLALISKDRDKRERREKEKKGLVKLLAGKGRKSKSSSSDTTPTHLSADAVVTLGKMDTLVLCFEGNEKAVERYRCIVPYPPQTEHELELELGDIVHVHKRRDDGWFKGTQERTSKTGLFPGSFVEKCD